MGKSYHTEKYIYPVTWDIHYTKFNAFVNVKNQVTHFNDTRQINYSMFYFDQEITENFLNIALLEIVRESFNNDDKYLDWLEYSINTKQISDDAI